MISNILIAIVVLIMSFVVICGGTYLALYLIVDDEQVFVKELEKTWRELYG